MKFTNVKKWLAMLLGGLLNAVSGGLREVRQGFGR